MTRRLSQQIDPQFHTMLMIAASGAVLIALGYSLPRYSDIRFYS